MDPLSTRLAEAAVASSVRNSLNEPLSYSRLQTYLECGHKALQVYERGFEAGIGPSYLLKGILVHKAIELLHDYDFWGLSEDSLKNLADDILDSLWKPKLGGKEELEYLKRHRRWLDAAYADTKRIYLAANKKETKAPWMTTIFRQKYGKELAEREALLARSSRIAGIYADDAEALSTTFAETYQFTHNYICAMRNEFSSPPASVALELDLAGAVTHLCFDAFGHVYQFRGFIDNYTVEHDETDYVYDAKTSRKTWTHRLVINHDQLWLYATFIALQKGRLPDFIGIVDVRNSRIVTARTSKEAQEKFHKRWTKKLEQHYIHQLYGQYTPAAGNPYSNCDSCDIGKHGSCPYFQL